MVSFEDEPQPSPRTGKGRQDISPELRHLDQKPAIVQAEFWKKLCSHTFQQQLQEIGGLPPDELVCDVVTRFFDSSDKGLHNIFRLANRDQKDEDVGPHLLTREGLLDALTEHMQVLKPIETDEESREAFETWVKTVGVPCNVDSFCYAIRRLRTAILLVHFGLERMEDQEEHKKVYHLDYDDDYMHSPFNRHDTTKKVRAGKYFYNVPVMKKQEPIHNLAEYLFTNKMTRKGNVHWIHLQRPRLELVLALGQVYRMPGRIQTCVRNLKSAQPQIFLKVSLTADQYHKREEHHRHLEHARTGLLGTESMHSLEHEEPNIDPNYEWSCLVYPGLYMDESSASSLSRYEAWKQNMSLAETRKKAGKGGSEPPRVRVATTQFALAMIWSDASTKTLVSMCGVPRYVGRWITDTIDQSTPSAGWKFMDQLTCQGPIACCTRRRKDGYEQVPQDEEDAINKHHSDLVEERLFEIDDNEDCEGEVATNEDESCCTFEKCFSKTLQALENQNSLLRTGDNLQLMTRMMLNNSQKYMDVASLYDAALARLRWLLNEPNMDNKDIYIDKVEKARRELSDLLRIVKPFQEYVIPSLVKLGEEFPDSVSDHQIKELVNNMNTFMPKITSSMDMCESLTSMYDRDASDRMNTVLNILTFITFVITPMQLMTGLYGMNFRIIPELDWHYGYHYFWAMSLTLSFAFALLLYCFTREN